MLIGPNKLFCFVFSSPRRYLYPPAAFLTFSDIILLTKPEMSTQTAASITKTLAEYDALVRQAVASGNVKGVMDQHGVAIVSHGSAMRLVTDISPPESIL